MSSNIRLDKTCQFCGNKYVAKTTVTKFCSDECAKRAYKARIREQKIMKAVEEEQQEAAYNPIVSKKDFLSIKEACLLVGVSRWTLYRLIDKASLNAGKLGRRTIIRRIDIDSLFK